MVDVPVGHTLNFDQFVAEKLCKNGVEVAENFWGVQAVLHNKFWALRAQILPITGL